MKKLLLLLAATALLAGNSSLVAQTVTSVAAFNPGAGEFPEGIAVDRDGNVYLSLIGNSKIKKVTPNGVASDFVSIPDGPILGMKFDRTGNLHIAAGHGIWKVDHSGNASLFSSVPGHALLNDLAFDKQGNLYVTDSFAYVVWKVDPQGNSAVWSADPLLLPAPTTPPIFGGPLGPNGIAFDHEKGSLYVLVTQSGRIVEIPVEPDGSASPAGVYAEDNALAGADGMALDNGGNIYVCANIQHQIVRVSPDGNLDILAQGGLLSTPTTLAFGRAGNQKTLFISNNSRFFSPNPAVPGPGLLKLDLGIPGRPLP